MREYQLPPQADEAQGSKLIVAIKCLGCLGRGPYLCWVEEVTLLHRPVGSVKEEKTEVEREVSGGGNDIEDGQEVRQHYIFEEQNGRLEKSWY